MSAFGVRADIFGYGSKSPLIAISGHMNGERSGLETGFLQSFEEPVQVTVAGYWETFF